MQNAINIFTKIMGFHVFDHFIGLSGGLIVFELYDEISHVVHDVGRREHKNLLYLF